MMAFESDIRDNERLCIHLPINRIGDPFAKVLRIDIARVEKSLVEVLSCTLVIIVKGQNGNIIRHSKLLIKRENKRRKTTYHPSSKIQACKEQQEHQNDVNFRSERASREKVDAHRDLFLIHPSVCSLVSAGSMRRKRHENVIAIFINRTCLYIIPHYSQMLLPSSVPR